MIRAFPREPTVDAGATLALHVATDAARFWLRLERWSDRAVPLLERGPFPGVDAPPGDAQTPWAWPLVELALPSDLPGGAYVVRCVAPGGAPARGAPRDGTPDARWGTALVAVRDRAPRVRDAPRVLVNLPLFTYHAYNVAEHDGTRGAGEGNCLYSGSRAVTLRRPGGGTGGHPWDEVNADVYDRASPRQTFAHWDLPALAWLAREGIAVDVCTDLDLHRGDVVLERYALLCTFGHDEYWTRAKRARVEAWIEAGGNVAFFGGNTCWFRVRWNEERFAIERDGRWSDDEPEDALTGLSFRAGGGKWIGERPPTGYRIEDAAHPLLRDAGLRAGEVIGAPARLIGYEFDGIDEARAPRGLQVLARAAPVGWEVGDGSGELSPHANAAMVAFRRGRGTIFNAGTADWARVLAADPRVTAIARSVVRGLSENRGG